MTIRNVNHTEYLYHKDCWVEWLATQKKIAATFDQDPEKVKCFERIYRDSQVNKADN